MWRNNRVYRVRLDHSQKTVQYVFGMCYENDLIYLIAHNHISKSPTEINTRKILIKVSGYDFI